MLKHLLSQINKIISSLFFPAKRIMKEISTLDLLPIKLPDINCFNAENLSKISPKKITSNKISLPKIIRERTIGEQGLSILKINACTNSKSNAWGYSYPDMYFFGKELIEIIKIQKSEPYNNWECFDTCMEHVLKNNSSSFNIIHHCWNDKYTWENSGGSHHFAAAIYYAKKNGLEYKITANINKQYIDKKAFNILNERYTVFLMNITTFQKIYKFIKKAGPIFTNSSLFDCQLLFLDKNFVSARKLIPFFESFDEKYIINVNKKIAEALQNQELNHKLMSFSIKDAIKVANY